MKRMFFYLPLVALTLVTIGLSACETVEGAGRDMENAGESMQEAAHDNHYNQ